MSQRAISTARPVTRFSIYCRLLIAITARPSSWSHTTHTLRHARDVLFTSIRACCRETTCHEIFPVDLDERVASKNPHDIHFAFDLHRLPSFRDRDDNSCRFQLWCRDRRNRQAGAHQQSHVDHASANLVPAANPANTWSPDCNPPDMVQWRLSTAHQCPDHYCG